MSQGMRTMTSRSIHRWPHRRLRVSATDCGRRFDVHRPREVRPNVMRLSLAVSGEKLTGTIGGRPIEGTVRGTAIELGRQGSPRKDRWRARISRVRQCLPTGPCNGAPCACRRGRRRRGRTSSSHRVPLVFLLEGGPALRIHPGDTVRTWSVDAGGRDRQGSALPGRQPPDRTVLRRRRDAKRHAGRAAEPRAHQPRLGAERKHDHAELRSSRARSASEVGSRRSTAAGSSMRRRTSPFSRNRPSRSRT